MYPICRFWVHKCSYMYPICRFGYISYNLNQQITSRAAAGCSLRCIRLRRKYGTTEFGMLHLTLAHYSKLTAFLYPSILSIPSIPFRLRSIRLRQDNRQQTMVIRQLLVVSWTSCLKKISLLFLEWALTVLDFNL